MNEAAKDQINMWYYNMSIKLSTAEVNTYKILSPTESSPGTSFRGTVGDRTF